MQWRVWCLGGGRGTCMISLSWVNSFRKDLVYIERCGPKSSLEKYPGSSIKFLHAVLQIFINQKLTLGEQVKGYMYVMWLLANMLWYFSQKVWAQSQQYVRKLPGVTAYLETRFHMNMPVKICCWKYFICALNQISHTTGVLTLVLIIFCCELVVSYCERNHCGCPNCLAFH